MGCKRLTHSHVDYPTVHDLLHTVILCLSYRGNHKRYLINYGALFRRFNQQAKDEYCILSFESNHIHGLIINRLCGYFLLGGPMKKLYWQLPVQVEVSMVLTHRRTTGSKSSSPSRRIFSR